MSLKSDRLAVGFSIFMVENIMLQTVDWYLLHNCKCKTKLSAWFAKSVHDIIRNLSGVVIRERI